MGENKNFTCEQCNEVAEEKGNIFWGAVLLLLIPGVAFSCRKKHL